MGIDDPYAAYCMDEACLYIVNQARDGKEPDFGRPARLEKGRGRETTNAGAVETLKALGIKMD